MPVCPGALGAQRRASVFGKTCSLVHWFGHQVPAQPSWVPPRALPGQDHMGTGRPGQASSQPVGSWVTVTSLCLPPPGKAVPLSRDLGVDEAGGGQVGGEETGFGWAHLPPLAWRCLLLPWGSEV